MQANASDSSLSGEQIHCDCCIAGAGPAGMMLAYLLARAKLRVVLLEKHADFLRDFRGDTVHPSTLELLAELGLKERFDALPQQRVEEIKVLLADGLHAVGDFRGIKPFPYLALVPQWDFLSFLANEARRYPGFELRMQHEALRLISHAGRTVGVEAASPQGSVRISANLVVACDGRSSTLRAASGLPVVEVGAPMDVLWFRLPRKNTDPDDTIGVPGLGRFLALINRSDYWQIAYVVQKGRAPQLREQAIESFQADVGRRVSFLADRTAAISGWDDVKLLDVRVDRLRRWHLPGFLAIGDAAHAMSPIGGVGINLAIQDAVAAGNWIAPALVKGEPPADLRLAAVQLRREPPTRIVQALQVLIQDHLIAPALSAENDPRLLHMPKLLENISHIDAVRSIPAKLFGVGPLRQHVSDLLRSGP